MYTQPFNPFEQGPKQSNFNDKENLLLSYGILLLLFSYSFPLAVPCHLSIKEEPEKWKRKMFYSSQKPRTKK